MARETGAFSFSGNFEVTKKGALDARAYCASYADLLSFTAANFIYNGHVVSVWDADVSKRGLYRCVNEADLSNAASWQKVGDDISPAGLEKVANKNVANGYAGLDGNGLVPAVLLPSYVDDVIERSAFAALPAVGETGKIYVTTDTNKTYRWSGSVYIEISASPGSTDAIPEGSVNRYYSDSRAMAAPLTGLTATAGAPVASDTMLGAWGKVLGFINNIAATIRGAVLTGFSTSTVAVNATDTMLSGMGKLQGQISNKAVLTDFQTTATDITKVPTVKSITDYLDYWKQQANNWVSPTFSGIGGRMVHATSSGELVASIPVLEEDAYVTDNDVISACVAATFIAANNYMPVIVPANGKKMNAGCFCVNGEYKYEAVLDNTIIRIKISE